MVVDPKVRHAPKLATSARVVDPHAQPTNSHSGCSGAGQREPTPTAFAF
eukprot:COSAG04_NODE_2685_length_3740_cov_2.487229_5_plen_49_part_00